MIKVSANTKINKAKRLERAQVGYQLKHLRAAAFKQLPKKLQTPELRKAMYDLTPFDNAQVIGTPTVIGLNFNRGNNAVHVRYHDDSNSIIPQKPDITFDDAALEKLLPYVKDAKLKNLLVTFQQRYQQLCEEIRTEQYPAPKLFSRPVDSRESVDLIQINDQFKDNSLSDDDIKQRKAKLSAEDQKHIDAVNDLYVQLSQPGLSEEAQAEIVNQLTQLPVLACEYQFMRLPENVKPTRALTARVYQILAQPIDYLDLYKAVFRGKQKRMSQKLMKELDVCRYAVKYLNDEEFANVNPHRAAVLTWKLINSEDVDNESVATMLNYNDRLIDRTDRAQIHHNPEIMADSWIVEAFNNRNNAQYSVEILKAAKAADSDLNRFKLFLNDTELVPRRLNIFLGMHYLQHKRTLPGDGMEALFRSFNHCRYPGQVNSLLNIAVTQTPGLVVPPKAIYEAIVSANKIGAHHTVAPLSNYIRHTTGLGWDRALPMDYRTGSIYIDSMQQVHNKEQKIWDLSLDSEIAATLEDMMTRGSVPHVFTQDIVDAFLIPEADSVDSLTLLGGNTDERTQPQVMNNKNHAQLKARQAAQDKAITDKLATFNVNVQHHVLPSVAFTAINYAMRQMHKFARAENLAFRKPVRLYMSNMQTLLEDFNNNRILPTDRNNSTGSIDQINTDLNGDKIYQDGEAYAVDDLAALPRDKNTNSLINPAPTNDINQDFINLSKALDTADMFDKMADEKRSPISPHVAHLVEQAIPTIAFNPHVYEDVLDIIYIKTGIHGDRDAHGKLRNPDKIDQYLCDKIVPFLTAFGIRRPIINKRLGYIEIDVDQMNQFLTIDDLDGAAQEYNVAQEKHLQKHEEMQLVRARMPLFDALTRSGAGADSDDEFGIGLGAMALASPLHEKVALVQQYKDLANLKYNDGRRVDNVDELITNQVLKGITPNDIVEDMKEMDRLKYRFNLDTIPFPESLVNTLPKEPKM